MNHVKHPQTNFTFTAPPDMENCDDLCVVRGEMQGTPVILSYWKPTEQELIELVAGGHVRLGIVGNAMPPVMVSVVNEALTSV